MVLNRGIMPRGSHQLQALETRMSLLADDDDDVVVHRNAERLRHGDNLLGHLDVGTGRRRIAGARPGAARHRPRPRAQGRSVQL